MRSLSANLRETRSAEAAAVCFLVVTTPVFCLWLLTLIGDPWRRISVYMALNPVIFAVEIGLFCVLFRILKINKLGIVLALAHLVFICTIAAALHCGVVRDPVGGMEMGFWTVAAAIDLPVSLLGLVLLGLALSRISSVGVLTWAPGVFLAFFGSLQYYFVGRLAQACLRGRTERKEGKSETAATVPGELWGLTWRSPSEPPHGGRKEGEITNFHRGLCIVALLVVQANAALLYLVPVMQRFLPRAMWGLPPLLMAGFLGAMAFSVLRPDLGARAAWLVSFVPFSILIGSLRLVLPASSFVIRYGLPHMPLALVGAAAGASLGVWCGNGLAQRGVRIRNWPRLFTVLAGASLFTCCLWVTVIQILSF